MCIRFQVPIEQRHMDFEDFKKVVDKSVGCRGFTLVGMGEPLVAPHLFQAIEYIKQKEVPVRLTTNGILLHERAERLVACGLNGIHISIENIRQTDLLESIKRLMKLRKTFNTTKPRIILQPILFDDPVPGRTLQDLYEIIEWGGQNGVDRINVARVDLRTDPCMNRPDLVGEKKVFAKFAELRRKYPQLRLDCLQDQIFSGAKGWFYKRFKFLLRLDSFCYRLRDFIYVDVNGNVHPCPINMEQIMGNLLHQDLFDIWHGSRFRELRKNQNKYEFCRHCDFLKLGQVSPRAWKI